MQKQSLKDVFKIFLLVIVILAGFGAFYWQFTAANAEIPEIWGIADAKEININSKVAGRVIKLYVDEGNHVEKGQILAKIDSDTQEPQKRSAQANLAAQYAQLQQILISSQNIRETLNASLRVALARENQAKTALNLAEKDEIRFRELLNADAVSIQTYDTYKSKFEDAQAVFSAAQADVAAAKANLLQNDQNKALEDAARQQIASLQAQIDSVDVLIDETHIFAPFSGTITKKFVEEGMLISSTVPIYSLQDQNDNWIDFKVNETDLKDFSLGESVILLARDDFTKISGSIENIRRKADFATQKATSERGDTDIIAFNIKIRTDNPNVWPGMRFKIVR